ncbi:MAG TPA: hypothetical protein VFF17_06600 [Thermoanaerobaculia bacterium]|nr:hypothetical protein [Thermoanaerobaculia bacterium]
MKRRAGFLLLLALSGLFLYLWPAFSAPVVLWSDSSLDLDWARRGVGIVSAVPSAPLGAEQPAHPAKPAYLLFLRLVTAVAPASDEERAIVVVQSILLWLSIAWTSWFVARRRGWGIGVAVYVVLILFLRVRDSASAVMPEAVAAALLLPIAARLLDLPRTRTGQVALGLATALLFWVRPNVGGIALVLALATLAARREWRVAPPLLSGFALVFVPVWLATRGPSDGALRGLSRPILEASVPYGWIASSSLPARISSQRDIERSELAAATSNWRAALAMNGTDVRRDFLWRALHGVLGTEFYDSRWSPAYGRLTGASRVATPFIVLAASILVLRRSPAGLVLLALLVVQNLLIGSRPRFVLPFLPPLFLFAAVAASSRRGPGRTERIVLAAAFSASVILAATQAHVLDREWGRIESGSVSIRQRIPRGSLPREAPATLHVRVAAPVVPSAAHVMVLASDGTALYRSDADDARGAPTIGMPLPQSLLDANGIGPVEIRLVSFGSYGGVGYLLFPVIPPPWRARATRERGESLSPSTGIRNGSLDWWAHAGLDVPSTPGSFDSVP